MIFGTHPRLPVLFRQPEPPAKDRPGPAPVPSGFAPRLFEGFDAPARERAALDRGVDFSARSTSFFLEGRDFAPRFRFAPINARTLASSLRPSNADFSRPTRHACAVALVEHPIRQLTAKVRPFVRVDARQFLAATKRRDLHSPPVKWMPTIGDRRKTKTVCGMSVAGRGGRGTQRDARCADMWRATYPHICVGCGYVAACSRSA